MTVKTRFPPSPTGFLHIGSLRTALYNFYFAKKHQGKFLLRIEDTDQTRLVEGAVQALIRTLTRMGIAYDEGPFIQSERLAIYKEHALKLIEKQKAYYCFCSKERLEELRKNQASTKRLSKYDRACLKLSQDEIATRLARNEPSVIRMHIPEGMTTFLDEVHGSVTIDNKEIDDQVLLKTDGFPTYHLAVVVDDHLMGVTHVIRGEEWISSVPKHVMLYEWFGWSLPVFGHLPLILNPDKSKLSKRQGDVSVEDFLDKGYLEEALNNYVSLLGFNPTGDREIYTQKEFIEAFDLKKINKGGAMFDVNKLLWMNEQYLKRMTGSELAQRVRPYLEATRKVIPARLNRICEVEKTRMSLLSDIAKLIEPYEHLPTYDPSLLVWKKSDAQDATQQLERMKGWIEQASDDLFENVTLIEQALKRYIEDSSSQTGNVLWPLRVALSGKEKSASPFELLWIFGREEALKRVSHALTLSA